MLAGDVFVDSFDILRERSRAISAVELTTNSELTHTNTVRLRPGSIFLLGDGVATDRATGPLLQEAEGVFDPTQLRAGGLFADEVALVVGNQPRAKQGRPVVDSPQIGVDIEVVLQGFEG